MRSCQIFFCKRSIVNFHLSPSQFESFATTKRRPSEMLKTQSSCYYSVQLHCRVHTHKTALKPVFNFPFLSTRNAIVNNPKASYRQLAFCGCYLHGSVTNLEFLSVCCKYSELFTALLTTVECRVSADIMDGALIDVRFTMDRLWRQHMGLPSIATLCT